MWERLSRKEESTGLNTAGKLLIRIPRLEGIDKGSSLVSVLQRDSLTSPGAHNTGRDPRTMDLEGLLDCSQLAPTQLQRDDFLSSRVLEVFL